MAVGMVLIPIGDSIAKFLSVNTPYSAGFLAWSRFALGALLITPFALKAVVAADVGWAFYAKHSLRGLLISGTILMIITAVGISPIAEVFGAFFIGPVVAVLLSVILLKESVSRLEWTSVVLGFVGVLLVVQPDSVVSTGLLWALAAGVCYGSFLVATRWTAGSGPPVLQLAVQFYVGFMVLMPFAITDMHLHGLHKPLPIVVMGLTSALANFLSILALARAKAAYLAPMVYLQIVAATAIGVFVFHDQLDTLAVFGLGLILLAGSMKIPLPKHRL